MDMRRVVLYAALAFIIYSLWTAWNNDYPAVRPVAPASNATVLHKQDALLPNVPGSNATSEPVANNKTTTDTESSQRATAIQVTTDVLALTIDSAQGDVIKADLLAYPVKVDDPQQPIQLLYDRPQQRYIANSNLFVSSGGNIDNLDFNFQSAQTSYQMGADQNEMTVTLTGQNPDGLVVKKHFQFQRGSYLVKVSYDISNQGESNWTGYLNSRFLRSSPEEDTSSMFHVGSYTGASYSSPGQQKYKKVSFKDMGKSNLNVDATGGWIAMQQHYFLSAWVPDADSKNVLYTRAANGDYTIGAVSQAITIAPGANKKLSMKLYLGPEDTSVLNSIAPGLDMTVDYGWLWFLSSALFSVMKAIHRVVGNWGWTIVLVTVLIKLAFYRLSASSYRSMAGMRQLQPKLLALRERYGDDKAKISQATMELYRQEKVNPLGGCLPILVQIPVFIALYWVLLESVELRQAPFVFWINDLAVADPYHVLPVIMGLTMLIQQRLNPAPPDPMQAKIMMFLPVLFTALFWNFPAGLVLYWIVNNTLSILQQWYITRRYSNEPPKNKKTLTAVK